MKRLIISTKEITYLVAYDSIIYCKSDNSYTQISTLEGECLLVSKPIYKIEEALNNGNFIRISQSFLVNRMHIIRIDKKNRNIVLVNNAIIPYSIKVAELLSFFKD